MAIVDFGLFKQHVRADDFSDDDVYLAHLLATAEEAVLNETNRSLDELLAMGGGTIPKRIVHAVMMLAAHWYNQRESAASIQMHEVPGSLSALIKPLKRLT